MHTFKHQRSLPLWAHSVFVVAILFAVAVDAVVVFDVDQVSNTRTDRRTNLPARGGGYMAGTRTGKQVSGRKMLQNHCRKANVRVTS